MRKISSISFIPTNAKFAEELFAPINPMEILKRKIKKNPLHREKIRYEAKKSGLLEDNKRSTISYPPQRHEQEPERTVSPREAVVASRRTSVGSQEKSWIKNLTAGPIALYFGEKDKNGKDKPFIIDRFVSKKSLGENVDSHQMQDLYLADPPLIEDITEERKIEEYKKIKANLVEEVEEEEAEQKKNHSVKKKTIKKAADMAADAGYEEYDSGSGGVEHIDFTNEVGRRGSKGLSDVFNEIKTGGDVDVTSYLNSDI